MKNILFLSFIKYTTINVSDFYADILRQFIKHGDQVFVISLLEKKYNRRPSIIKEQNCTIIEVKINNYFNVGAIRKGLTLLEIENSIIKAIKKHCSNIKFDLVLYSTPPITLTKAISFIKKRDDAFSYLMLKDIFPQNAIDLGMMSLSNPLYRHFKKTEQKLYNISDRIGCMSEANVHYILKHNHVSPEKVEVCPNCVEINNLVLTSEEKSKQRILLNLPLGKQIFIYGGNLGRPQDVPFIIECLKTQINNQNAVFVIVGDGSDFHLLNDYKQSSHQSNLIVLSKMPKDDYNRLMSCCDFGLIFLDHRFTIPNFPSRLLSYMQAGLPVLALTDKNTDIGLVIKNNGFGLWAESDDPNHFGLLINKINEYEYSLLRQNEIRFLHENYSAEKVYSIIRKDIL